MGAKLLKTVEILGDKVLIDTDIPQDDRKSLIKMPDDVHRPTLKGVVTFLGTKISNPDIKIGYIVLVKNFVGAPHIVIEGRDFRLYDTENVLAIL